jgi:DNA processing protein
MDKILNNIEEVLPSDPHFPEVFLNLADQADEVKTIYCVGDIRNLNILHKKAISIVGSRNSTLYGEQMAYDLANTLSDSGWSIISGGAIGVDSWAHCGALESNGGKTAAFIAGGLKNLYPRSNIDLFARIVKSGGLIISENFNEQTNQKHLFLLRNRLIALYSQATILIEAAWRSGALSTAAHANRFFRPVGALPGPANCVTSAGTNELIKNNQASLVSSADDIVELASPVGQNLFTANDDISQKILNVLPKTAFITVEKIAQKTDLSFNIIISKLARLEMSFLAETDGLGWKKAA